jgi:thiol-disulfide isomerase/thioredoxin
MTRTVSPLRFRSTVAFPLGVLFFLLATCLCPPARPAVAAEDDADAEDAPDTAATPAATAIDVTPRSASFGRLYEPGLEERSVRIRDHSGAPFELELLPVPDGSPFEFTLREVTPGRDYELVTRTRPPYEVGPVSAIARLRTNRPGREEIRVTAYLVATDRIDVFPAPLVLPAPGAARRARGIRVQNRGETPVRLLDATVDDPAVSLRRRTLIDGKFYLVEVSCAPDHSLPAEGRTITLRTDDPERATLTVPLRELRQAQPIARSPAANGATPRRPALGMEGRVAPAFELETLEGDLLTSGDFEGRFTVLNFFAPNCGYCKKQIPVVESVRSEFQELGVRFFNVAETMGKVYSNDEVARVLESLGSRLAVAPDPGNHVGRRYKATSYPTLFVIDVEGKVARVYVGANTVTSLRDDLDRLVRG